MIFTGRAEALLPSLDEILKHATASGDEVTLFTARNLVVGALFAADRAADGIELAEQNRILAEQLASDIFRTLSLFALGGAIAEQNPDRARQLFRESAELGRAARMEYMTAMALARLGRMAGATVDEAWARDFRVAVDLSVDSGDPRTLTSLFELYGQVLGAHERPESATLLLSHWAATSPDVSNPVVHNAVERWRTRLTSELGEAEFTQLWADGAVMTAAAAVQLVHAELDRMVELRD